MSEFSAESTVLEKAKKNPHTVVTSPYTQAPIGAVKLTSIDEIPNVIQRAKQGLANNKCLSRKVRASILGKAADLIEYDHEAFARLIVVEAGKTITQARKEVTRCVNTIRLSGEEAKRVAGEVIPFDAYGGAEDRHGYSVKSPIGIVLAITPFNDPLNLVAHKLGPAIAAGNSVILKPSELTPFSAQRLVDTFVQAGLAAEVITVVQGDKHLVEQLVKAQQINMVTFTGGVATGKAITAQAGLKKIAMDLGGVAPVIVMRDAHLAHAVSACVSGAFWGAGQNCIGTQHILIHKSLYSAFKQQFVMLTEGLCVGDPALDTTDMGPMITEQHAIRVEQLVNDALQHGAKLLIGHTRKGNLYMPTVLENVPDSARLATEEVFGPVVTLRPFSTIEEAVEIANRPVISLNAGIFTYNLRDADYLVQHLDVSGVMVNDSSDFRIDAMPFGGFKLGCLGREGVRYAIEEMTQSKVICFKRMAD